ncbi:MAG TPA: GNAT family N-acetyltransferase [Terriglobia bacterium]|nr:GNAT family N-acetyltransferase [Terriglobia bacterium]
MKESIGVKIREYEERDGSAIEAIQKASREAAQWRAEDYRHLAAEPGGLVLVAELPPGVTPPPRGMRSASGRLGAGVDPLAGFVAFHRVGEDAELRNLAVDPAYRQQGIGKRLVCAGHHRLRGTGVRRVYLEVRASNIPALSLYSTLGYIAGPGRKAYYRDPEEDACVLSLTLRPPAS